MKFSNGKEMSWFSSKFWNKLNKFWKNLEKWKQLKNHWNKICIKIELKLKTTRMIYFHGKTLRWNSSFLRSFSVSGIFSWKNLMFPKIFHPKWLNYETNEMKWWNKWNEMKKWWKIFHLFFFDEIYWWNYGNIDEFILSHPMKQVSCQNYQYSSKRIRR